MQPTFAAFNFKSSSNDLDGRSSSTLEENIDTCHKPYKHGPQRNEKCFHPHGLASLTCLVSMRKEERCIYSFILMELMIKIGV